MEGIKYYTLEGSFVKNLPEENTLEEAIKAHLEYLDVGFKDGSVLVSGPKIGVGGGIIIVKYEDIDKFCNDDPLVKAGIQEYRITEFKLHKCQDFLTDWFK
jgi:uncharacterized protein YciI